MSNVAFVIRKNEATSRFVRLLFLTIGSASFNSYLIGEPKVLRQNMGVDVSVCMGLKQEG